MAQRRRLERAEVLAVGSELLVGETRDTNSGDLARELTAGGVEVTRLVALPDRLDAVVEAIRGALARADLVVTTGGLGPTPDDLTREAIAAVCDAVPTVDPGLERWLRGLFERRGLPFADANIKQAWVIPGATPLANAHGTAPGWWVERPDGRVIVALPGPPREMEPMWRDGVAPRLRALGIGSDRAAETLRLTGIGESALVGLIGADVLARSNPEVATYARADAVDVRVSARAADGRPAAELVRETIDALLPRIGSYVFARGDTTWVEALGAALDGRTVATSESGTAGQLAASLGPAPWLRYAEVRRGDDPLGIVDARTTAARVRASAGVDIGLAVLARDHAGDTAVTVAIAQGPVVTEVSRTAFLAGPEGRRRAAVLACAVLWERLVRTTRADS